MAETFTPSTTSNLANQTSITSAIDSNFSKVSSLFSDVLSRSGVAPNAMGSSLDMNSNQVLNLPIPGTPSSPLRLQDLQSFVGPGQVVTNNTIITSQAYATVALATAASIDPAVTAVNTVGYAAAGDGGGARYIRTGGSTLGGFQSLDSQWWKLDLEQPLFGEMFGAKGDGTTDNATAINNAFSLAAGREVRLGPGTFVIKSSIGYTTNTLFAPGLRFRGAGRGVTIIDVQTGIGVKSSGAISNFQLGGWIKDLDITTTTTGLHGFELFAVYQFTVENVYAHNLTGNGGMISGNLADADASNIIKFINCRFDSNAGAGLLCNFASTDVQTSFVHVEDCSFNSNTLAGFYFIGLQACLINCAFATNTGPGLWVVNNAGSNAQFYAACNSFENNGSVSAPNLRLDALQQGQFYNTEIANNSQVAQIGIAITGVNNRFEGTRIRVSSANNPYTAFKFGAGSTNNVISNTYWITYDATGQTRYDTSATTAGGGNRISDSAFCVQENDDVVPSTVNSGVVAVNGTTHNQVLNLGGTLLSVTGPTGSFSIGGLTNGYPGRVLYLNNNSGQTMTLLAEDASATAANRFHFDGLSNITINNLGTAHLVYSGQQSRWLCLGHG